MKHRNSNFTQFHMRRVYTHLTRGLSLFRALSLLSTLSFFGPTAIADTLTLVADPWCPYNCEPDGDLPGYGIEIANYAFGKEGHTVIYKNINWARAVRDTKIGKYSALISAYKGDAPGFIFPEEPFGVSSVGIFVRKESDWTYDGLASLKELGRVATINAYVYSEQVMAFIEQNPTLFEQMSGDHALDNNIRKLSLGRVDGILEDPNVFMTTAKKLGIEDQFKLAGSVNKGDKLYIAFSPNLPKSKEYASILSAGIRELIESGEMNKIMQKYSLKYWR